MARKQQRKHRRKREREPADVSPPKPTDSWWTVSAAVTAVAMLLFVRTLCPTVPFGDGGELIAAADSFGVAHPPGYPLYTALGWLVLQVPWGEPALRVNAMSALWGALTCGAVAWLVCAHTRRAAAGAAAGLGLAASATFWSVATVAEVYTLHLFLVTLLLCAATVVGRSQVEATRARALLLAGVAFGLGLAHHPTIVLAVPAAVLLAARFNTEGAGRGARGLARLTPAVPVGTLLAAAALALLIPALLDWSLMIRARQSPASNWGRVTSLPALRAHVTAVVYRANDLGWAGLGRGAGWRQLGEFLLWQFTPLVLPLAAVGIAGLSGAKRFPGGGVRAAAAALIVAGSVFGLRYVTDDTEVFFLTAFLGTAIAAGLGVGTLLRHRRAEVRWIGVAGAVLMPLLPAVHHFTSHDLRHVTGASDFAWDILNSVPANGILFVDVDDAFGVMYLHQVLGERADVTVYNRAGLIFRDLAVDVPLEPMLGEVVEDYRLRLERGFVGRLLADVRHREVLYLGRPDGGISPDHRIEPYGLLYRLRRADEEVWTDDHLWAAYREAGVRKQTERMGDPSALAIAAGYPMARGEKQLALGNMPGAVAALDDAGRLAQRSSGVQNYIGALYGEAGDYPRAISYFERAVAIKPSADLAWRNLAVAYEASGDLDGARGAWSRMAAIGAFRNEARGQLRRLGR